MCSSVAIAISNAVKINTKIASQKRLEPRADAFFARRAETIARTELTFAYNAGRLDTYRELGLVSHVFFYTI
jgi:sulfite exporter TauE/SafE